MPYPAYVIQSKKTRFILMGITGFFCLVFLQWLATNALIAVGISHLPPQWTAPGWPFGYFGHAAQLLVALAFITALRRVPGFDPGLRWPRGRSYVGIALVIGAAFGILMLLVDNGPDIWAMRAPEGPYDARIGNVLPWLLMQGVFVGITEEVPFRSLFLAYLLPLMPQRIGVCGIDVSAATVVTALIFSLAHLPSFWSEPFYAALGQQIYVTALGIFYGWLFERSRSVLAPIIAHNAGDFVEWSFLFAMRAAWG